MKKIEKFLRSICYPQSNLYHTELERELTYQRSKCLIFIQLTFTSCLLIYRPFVLERAIPSIDMWIAFGITALILHLMTARRYHKQYEYFYNGCVMILSPYSVKLFPEAIFGSWMIYFITPVYIFFLTGSIKHFTAQAIAQIICSIFVFKIPTLEVMEKYGNEDFLKRFIKCFIVGQILLICTMIQLDNSRKVAYERAALLEARKEEVERQRTFLLSFSHELRNMMNSVMGSIEICLMDDLPEKLRDVLLGAKLCSKILLQEINNILDSGKVEINELEIHKVPLRTRSLLNKIWMVSSELIKKRSLNGLLAIRKNMPSFINLDEGRFTQIILNIIGNATKFTEKGSIELILEWNDSSEPDPNSPIPFQEDGLFEKKIAFLHLNSDFECVSIGGKIPKRQTLPRLGTSGIIRVYIRDSGCGMSEEESKKLFQKFSQVGDNRQRMMGTGLGLFISKYICNKMGGNIDVYSKKGLGTVFIVTLPVNIPEQDVVASIDEIRNFHQADKIERIHTFLSVELPAMIVDDEDFNIMVINNFLNKVNAKVIETAKNGEVAFEKYKSLCFQGRAPVLVTMDIYMPIMDGKEAARKIRDFEARNNLKKCLIVMISGNCSHTEMQACMNPADTIKADGFLKKPVNVEEFKELVFALIQKYQNN